jgi:integrase
MNLVEPIRDKEVVRDMIAYLKRQNTRNEIMFMMGVYTGLRISDILALKVKDVKGKRSLNIHDKKTGKSNRLDFNIELKRELDAYTKGRDPEEYLIKSRNGENRPITRGQAYKILHGAAKKFSMDNCGTHTLRKTFGFFLYDLTKDIVQVQTALNHSDAAYTRRYIGIDRDIVNKSIKRLRF